MVIFVALQGVIKRYEWNVSAHLSLLVLSPQKLLCFFLKIKRQNKMYEYNNWIAVWRWELDKSKVRIGRNCQWPGWCLKLVLFVWSKINTMSYTSVLVLQHWWILWLIHAINYLIPKAVRKIPVLDLNNCLILHLMWYSYLFGLINLPSYLNLSLIIILLWIVSTTNPSFTHSLFKWAELHIITIGNTKEVCY